jgi:hypothetical protein
VVVEGEDAVNIVQQRTAVAPVIEVRDRNNQPVAGAIVNFAVRNGRATFSGARTLTVTTNAAGRAVATGLTPTGSGAIQISASAAFQGQTAAVTIAQTNVMTGAQAAGAATTSGAGSSGAGTGGGASGGGGLSATTVGVVAGAAAAGTVVTIRELGSESAAHLYTGRFSGSESLSFSGNFCRTETLTGTLKMNLTIENNTVTGTADIDDGSITTTAVSSGCTAFLNRPDSFVLQDAVVTGTSGSITFAKAQTNVVPPNPFDPQGTTNTHDYTFTGSLSGSTITGTIAHRRIVGGVGAGATTFQVTLQ